MKNPKITVLIVGALVLFVAGLGIFLWRQREPEYQGRMASQWLGKLLSMSQEREEAENAFRSMGAKAVPFLVRVIEKDRFYELVRRHVPKVAQKWFPPRNPDPLKYRAPIALEKIGTNAVAALPALIFAMDDQPELRCNLSHALGAIAPNSKLENEAVDSLIRATKDPIAENRMNAYYYLGLFPRQADRIIPILVAALQADNSRAKISITNALQRFGKLAVPALIDAAKGESGYIRPAGVMLEKIDPEAARKAGIR